MWKCEKCGVEIHIKLKPPIRCSCELKSQNKEIIQKQSKQEIKPPQEVWKELHTYKFINSELARIFLIKWEESIPSFGCSCRDFWRKLLKHNPPDFTSAEAFFAWGVARHNDVNIKLGKPIMSLEEAKQVYNIMSPS